MTDDSFHFQLQDSGSQADYLATTALVAPTPHVHEDLLLRDSDSAASANELDQIDPFVLRRLHESLRTLTAQVQGDLQIASILRSASSLKPYAHLELSCPAETLSKLESIVLSLVSSLLNSDSSSPPQLRIPSLDIEANLFVDQESGVLRMVKTPKTSRIALPTKRFVYFVQVFR